MRICFINDTFVIGRGVDNVIYELARRLGKSHEVIVVCSRDFCNIKPENFKIKKIEIGKLFTGTIKDFTFPLKLLKLRKEIKKIKCDVINLHHSTLSLALIGFRNIVVTYHGSPPAYGVTKYFRTLVNFVGRISLRFMMVIAVSKYLGDELTKFGIPEEKIKVIPNGVSQEFKPKWVDRGYMLFVGRLEKHKRIEQLIRISKEIDFSLKIVGDGPEREKLEKLKEELNAPVEFLGKVDRKKLIKLYQECSFFVSASRWEGFGLIFLEANACGKPVVGYDTCAIKEIIKNGFNGFKARSFDELLKYCRELKENKKLRVKLGKKARKFVEKYSWKNVVKKYERCFQMAFS